MKLLRLYLYSFMAAFSIMSCKKEYERPDHFSVDLFKNERNEQKQKVLSADEAMEKSLLVITSNNTVLVSKPKINNRAIFIFRVNEGKILKSPNDSSVFPVKIISDHNLQINQGKQDSIVLYLIRPKSYKLLIKDFDVKYQILPSAPAI